MKKNLFRVGTIAAATTAFFMVSCSNDDIMSNGASGDEVQLSFNLGLENAAVTRAIGDGTTVNTLSYAVYSNGTLTKIAPVDHDKVSYPAQVTITLAKGQEYDIVFWADADTCYNFSAGTNEANITVDYSKAKNNNEGADAFFAKKRVNVSSNQNIDVTLKRPFAQINVGTIDKAAAEAAGVEITQSSVKISGLANTLNLLSGEATASDSLANELTFALNDIPTQKLSVADTTYDYMSMTYVLLPHINERQVINTEFTFKSSSNDITLNVPSVPAQRNYRTNILGSILTSQVDINVSIDADFEEDDYIVRLGLEEIALNGGYFSLPNDIVLSETLEFTKDATINLNGHTISMVANGAKQAIPFKVLNGHLIINGEGTVDATCNATDAACAVWVRNDAEVTINGGHFRNNISSLIYADGNGKVTINGGTFESDWVQGNYRYVLNVGNSSNSEIIVNGGTFINYNPANGDDNLGGTFVAPTSTVAQNGNNYVVTPTTVSSAEEFVAAINDGRNFVMTEDIVLNAALTANNDIVIDGQGHAISGGSLNFNGTTTLKNIVFNNAKGEYTGSGASSLYFTNKVQASVTIEGCTFNTPQYECIQFTNYLAENIVINNNTFNNTQKHHRNIHIEMRDANDKWCTSESAKVTITNNTFTNPTLNKDAVMVVCGILESNTTLGNNIVTGNDAVVSDYYFWFSNYDRPNSTWVNFDWSFVAAGFSVVE